MGCGTSLLVYFENKTRGLIMESVIIKIKRIEEMTDYLKDSLKWFHKHHDSNNSHIKGEKNNDRK